MIANYLIGILHKMAAISICMVGEPPEVWRIERLVRDPKDPTKEKWVRVVSGPKEQMEEWIDRRKEQCIGGACQYQVVKEEP